MTVVTGSGEPRGLQKAPLQQTSHWGLPQGTASCWRAAFSQLSRCSTGSERCCGPTQPLIHFDSHEDLLQLLGRDQNPTTATLREILKLCVRNVKDSIAPISGLFVSYQVLNILNSPFLEQPFPGQEPPSLYTFSQQWTFLQI